MRQQIVGDEITQCGAIVQVTGVRDGRPYRLDIRLERLLDDPDLALLAWRNGSIERVAASQIANGLSIPWTPGPMSPFSRGRRKARGGEAFFRRAKSLSLLGDVHRQLANVALRLAAPRECCCFLRL